jgi:peptide/nickel transport system ATP-binding protein
LRARDLLALPESSMREYSRRPGIGMIFQEPATSLNPVLTVGRQIVEALELHSALRGEAARRARRGTARPGRHSRSKRRAWTNSPSSFPADCASA